MIHLSPALALASLLAPLQDAAAPAPFPSSTALAERVSPEGLASLAQLVRSFVEEGDVVGAELLVIAHGRTILHEGYGWRDSEHEIPMQPGGVFCVRSMTKPLIGAAIWMLIESDALTEDDRVAEFLPAFDVEGKRDITVGQLLRHQSGLPMSLILARDPRLLTSVRSVADLGGSCTLEFEPGTAFEYSDQGTDTLTAVIEVVTGAPAEDFVQERLLEPLDMSDTTCRMTADHPLRARACSLYVGSPGVWTRFWSPEDEALFPIFLGSQGLYSTAVDYARFLELYLDRGRAGGERLLRTSSVRHTLEPGPWPLPWPGGFPALRADYGTLMQLWTRDAAPNESGERELVVFGHGGSDGTHAWAFPEQDAIVLYFTQSRGTTTGWRVEERLGELFLGVPYNPLQAAPPLEQYLGYYAEDENDLYRAVVRDGEGLALEVLGRAVAPMDYIGEDRWKLRPEPSTVLAFDRDEDGLVSGYHIGEHAEFRIAPRPDLPQADEVAARITAAHQLERLAGAGVVRLHGRFEMPKLELQGESVLWLAWPNQWRMDDTIGGETTSVAFDGTTLRTATSKRAAAPLDGPTGELLRLSDPFLRFGDRRRSGATLTVVQELRGADGLTLLLRAGDLSSPGTTIHVDQASGRVIRIDEMTFIEGVGALGNRVRYSDFRDVAGALLPWRTEMEFAHALIGTMVIIVEGADSNVEVSSGWFQLDG